MQAIIMAAGKGSRMGNMTEDKPKSFLEIRGIKLLEYNIAMIHSYGIKDILIVTGYQNEKLESFAQQIEGVRCVYNPFYEMVNVAGSFFMAQEYLFEDTVFMHADTLCAPEIFEEMITTEADMVLPVEFRTCDEEAMKVRTKNGKLVEISKQIPCSEGEGEFIGIAKIGKQILPDIKLAIKKLMREKQFHAYFEGAIQELIHIGDYELKTISVGDRFWGEVDFLEDYERVSVNISDKLIALADKEWGYHER